MGTCLSRIHYVKNEIKSPKIQNNIETQIKIGSIVPSRSTIDAVIQIPMTPNTIMHTPNSSEFDANYTPYPDISFSENINYNTIKLYKTLDGYLSENMNHYTCFAIYLKDHYSLENLLFIQDALIFKSILKKSSGLIGNSSSNTLITSAFNVSSTFEYLTDITNDMYRQLGLNPELSDQVSNGLYKHAASVFIKIYNEYICDNAKYPINLSFGISIELEHYAKNPTELKSINDYINVFNPALREIWRLLSTTYLHHYKPHVISLKSNQSQV